MSCINSNKGITEIRTRWFLLGKTCGDAIYNIRVQHTQLVERDENTKAGDGENILQRAIAVFTKP